MNEKKVEYLLIGGYAVAYYGYPRTTGDMDIWIAQNAANAERVVEVLRAFGFGSAEVSPDIFLQPDKIHRMGIPPLRIELLTTVSGVDFADCWATREMGEMDGVPVNLINADRLRANKKASGRPKDLSDLKHLPEGAS